MPSRTHLGVREELIARAQKVAETVVAKHAKDVDREGRYPVESMQALKDAKLLGIAVPEELGGEDANVEELASICQVLGQACASTAMIFAMHQIQVVCLARHGLTSKALCEYMRLCATEQRLIASGTSELGVGGDVRSSRCAVVRSGSQFALEKQTSVISYGSAADDILVTARKSPEAAASDQVLVLVQRDQRSLERVGGWDALGMRGTCSEGFVLRSEAPVSQIFEDSFADISAQTMHPVSHIVWTHVWLGIATSAVSIARKYVRAEARKTPGVTPPNALRVAELVSHLHALRGSIRDGMHEYLRRIDAPEELEGIGFQIRMNNLKTATAEQVVPVIQRAMGICGISAYRNDTPYSLGRHLRDAYGAGVMILNDRLYGTNATLLLVSKED
jgi:acyl-CoA dehydrogenase